MNILRLLLLFFVGLFVRRLFKRPSPKTRGQSSGNSRTFNSTGHQKKGPEKVDSMQDITEQEIDDADFEEIP